MNLIHRSPVLLALLAALGVVVFLTWQRFESENKQTFTPDRRPQTDRLLFDYGKMLTYYQEGANKYLDRISGRYHIEAVIVTLPDLGSSPNIELLGVDLMNHWQIGGKHEGRGLLLLLVKKEKQVRVEVAYELEDVFTDAFVGYIEDLQLKPYFLNDDLGTGLIAVMEEIERRAQIKHQGDYTPGLIAKLDRELVAGGAGAKRDLERYAADKQPAPVSTNTAGRGADSPDAAWHIMLTKWAGKGAHIDTDIYTEMTKMAMGDQNKPDSRTKAALNHWRNTEFQVLQDSDHAVIYFGNRKGWNNAPFLFCRTPGGWKFDIVHQRRLVTMGPNPSWMVQQGRYPYVDLINNVPRSSAKDLPLAETDRYYCRNDARIATEIRALERTLKVKPNDFATVMALARLNVITGRRPNHVQPLLKRAKSLDPNSAEPYKYSAIYNVNTFLQYETARKEIARYIELNQQDPFGYNFLGFVLYRLRKYHASIEALEQAIQLDADNVYGYTLMARDYTLLYKNAKPIDPRRPFYKSTAQDMLRRAQAVPDADKERVARLQSWLKKQRML